MSRTITIKLHVRVPDGVGDDEAGESLFDTMARYADEDLIESVDGWDPA